MLSSTKSDNKGERGIMRKPISITTSHAIGEGRHIYDTHVVCDDGSIWERARGSQWHRLPDIPQDEEADKPMAHYDGGPGEISG